MAKVKGPLFSHSAHGALGKTLIYTSGKQGRNVTFYHKPTGSASADQLAVRSHFSQAKDAWNDLSPEEQNEYTTRALPLKLTGYNLYISEFSLDDDMNVILLQSDFNSDGSSLYYNIPGMSFDVEANSIYAFRLSALMTQNTMFDNRIKLTGPSGVVGNFSSIWNYSQEDLFDEVIVGKFSGDYTWELSSGYIQTSSTGGTIQLQIGTDSSDADAAIMMKGTFIEYKKIA